jgi:hypothetical protein
MKRRPLVTFIAVAALLLAAGYNGCSKDPAVVFSQPSTVAGNPISPTDGAAKVLAAVSETLARCFSGVSEAQAKEAILSTGGFAEKLGVDPGQYPVFSAIVAAESLGELIADRDSTRTCTASITALSCSDPAVRNAYDPAAADPFANSPALIADPDASLCAGVFTPTSASVQKLSGGYFHNCALTYGGDVYCWGKGDDGRLGQGSTSASGVPVKVQGLPGPVQDISAGMDFTCALAAGAVWCWGKGGWGTLGNGSGASSSVPVPVTGMQAGVESLSHGTGTSMCAIKNGGLYCWGYNLNGQLGNGTGGAGIYSNVPVAVQGLSSGVREAVTGAWHACALADSGVWCWGLQKEGALGGAPAGSQCYAGDACATTPGLVPGLVAGSIESLRGGFSSTCVRFMGGETQCWGRTAAGTGATPGPLAGFPAGIADVNPADASTCAIAQPEGRVLCQGANWAGQLGTGTTDLYASPQFVQNLSGVKDLSLAGAATGCALTETGQVWCWGDNGSGQVGAAAAATCPRGPCNPIPVVVKGMP